MAGEQWEEFQEALRVTRTMPFRHGSGAQASQSTASGEEADAASVPVPSTPNLETLFLMLGELNNNMRKNNKDVEELKENSS